MKSSRQEIEIAINANKTIANLYKANGTLFYDKLFVKRLNKIDELNLQLETCE